MITQQVPSADLHFHSEAFTGLKAKVRIITRFGIEISLAANEFIYPLVALI